MSNKEWTVNCDADWLTISPSTDTGNATITVEASQNSGAERRATITIIGHEMTECVTVRQMGYTPPPIPSNLSFSASGGTQHFCLIADFNWTISVEGGDGWLYVTPNVGSGYQDITINVSANPAVSTRSATITVSAADHPSQVIQITQIGSGFLSANTTNLHFSPDATTQKFTVTSNVEWNATVSYTDGSGWLTVTPTNKKPSGGSSNGEISVTTAANTGSSPRKATITITGGGLTQTVNIEQSGSGYLTVSTTSLLYNPDATTQKFTVTSNVEWTISVDGGDGWLTVSPLNGFGNAEIKVKSDGYHEQYPMPHYDATITISGGGYTRTVRATLSGLFFVVTKNSIQFDNVGGTQMLGIACRAPFILTIENGHEWLTADLIYDDGINRDYSIIAKENNSFADREATIIIEEDRGGFSFVHHLTVSQSAITDIKDIGNNDERTMLNGNLVYDLFGRCSNHILNDKNKLSKGLYIINGKKYIIKK